jgi:hypothetical protein
MSSSDNPMMNNFKPEVETVLQNTEMPVDATSDFYNPTNNKYKTSDPFEILNKDKNNPHKTDYKNSSDYEIYYQNELNTPKKCGKDKVRVYLDKDKRKVREASQNYNQAVKYCNQF